MRPAAAYGPYSRPATDMRRAAEAHSASAPQSRCASAPAPEVRCATTAAEMRCATATEMRCTATATATDVNSAPSASTTSSGRRGVGGTSENGDHGNNGDFFGGCENFDVRDVRHGTLGRPPRVPNESKRICLEITVTP